MPEQPSATPSASRRTLLRAGLVLGAATGLGAALGRGNAAFAAVTVHSTAAWGARAPSSPVSIVAERPNKILIHHTATANTTDLSQAAAYSLARSIQRHHMDTNGWIDSGQHFTISRGGYVLEGRHRSLETLRGGTGVVTGAHCPGQNSQAIGIENEGTYTSVLPPAGQYDTIVAFCADICRAYGLAATEIYGHRDFRATSCPGDLFYSRLPQLRTDVARALGTTPPGDWPTVRRGTTGERVRTIQYLLRQAGQTTVGVDGNFGSGTEAAVIAFQSAHGLTPDGVVGGLTWSALILTVRQGATGEAVKAVQSQLNAHGAAPTLVVDGNFGSGTNTAVRTFQAGNGLTVDGVVGDNTWLALVT